MECYMSGEEQGNSLKFVPENNDSTSYQLLFVDTRINARSRIVDTSGDQWDIGETKAEMINFTLLGIQNRELIDQLKYLIATLVKSKSPGHVCAIFHAVKMFLNSCEPFDNDFGEELADSLADEILYYFVHNRKQHDESYLSRIRLWYQLGTKYKLPMFHKTVSDALGELNLKGPVRGLDVLVHIEGKSPLNSGQLSDLRMLLQKYADSFSVGEAHFWRLTATWLFITLGIRTIQLRLLMVSDLAIHKDVTTSRKSYILSIPSVKKRYEKPRTRFKMRPIPVFLGELLEKLKNFNIQWLIDNGCNLPHHEIPLFMPISGHSARRDNARHSSFKNVYGSYSISMAPRLLLDKLNTLQKASGEKELALKLTPRRLRKTFATHAAACGTPALLLMELLDHDDMQHVMIYYKLGANFANKIDKVYQDQFGSIFEYFNGTITLRELKETNKSEQVFGPASLRRLVGIGFCSKDKLCRLAPPYSCYTCRKFEACNDKQVHEEVLSVMLDDVKQLFGENAAPEKYEINHIKACRSLILILEKD